MVKNLMLCGCRLEKQMQKMYIKTYRQKKRTSESPLPFYMSTGFIITYTGITLAEIS